MRVTPEDYGWIRALLAVAYSKSGAVWDEGAVAAMVQQGSVAFSRENHIFAAASARERPAIYGGIIPAGLSTQVTDAVPQHRSQQHMDRKISPVLADCLRGVAADVPDALGHPVFGFVPAELAKYWAASPVQAEIEIGFKGERALIYVSTLRLVIERLEAAGL